MIQPQPQQKSALKNSNPKIGRPAKTDQQQQFKNHYLQNKKKFQLQCELLVYIHQIFFQEIPTHPANNRVEVEAVVRLFQGYDCMHIYGILSGINQKYFKSSSMFPQDRLRYILSLYRYTSLIDANYMMRQIRNEHGPYINSYQLVFFLLFFLFNQRVVNKTFLQYFTKRIQVLRNGIINGPGQSQLNKMDTLIIALALEVAIRENMQIEEEVQEQDQGEGEEDMEVQGQEEMQGQGQMQGEEQFQAAYSEVG